MYKVNIIKKINFKLYRVFRKINIFLLTNSHAFYLLFFNKLSFRPNTFQRNVPILILIYPFVAIFLKILVLLNIPAGNLISLILIYLYIIYLNNFKLNHEIINLVSEYYARKKKINLFLSIFKFIFYFIVLPIIFGFIVVFYEKTMLGIPFW